MIMKLQQSKPRNYRLLFPELCTNLVGLAVELDAVVVSEAVSSSACAAGVVLPRALNWLRLLPKLARALAVLASCSVSGSKLISN